MITIIPALDVMKAVTDTNITSPASDTRRKAFNKANELMSLADVNILIDGFLFEKVKVRLNPDHITFFQSAYRIDDSAKGIINYNITKAIQFIAQAESKSRRVIIVTDSYQDYISMKASRINILSPHDFVDKINKAMEYNKHRLFTSLDDALMAVFFFPQFL